MIPPHTNRYPKPPSGAATGWGRFFCFRSGGAGGCGRCCKAPQASQVRPAPHCVGRLLRGQSPREKPPLTGEVAERQRWPEGLLRFAAVGRGAKDTWAVMARWRAGHARPLRGATNGLRTRGAREGGSPPPLQWAGAAVPGSPPFPRRAKPDDACAKRGGQRFYGEAVPGLRQRRRGGSLHGPCASHRG